MKNLLIIGGVAAGATAAARARRLDNDVNITLLEAGADVSFVKLRAFPIIWEGTSLTDRR